VPADRRSERFKRLNTRTLPDWHGDDIPTGASNRRRSPEPLDAMAAPRADETALLEPLVQGVRRPAARAANMAEGQFQRSNQRRRSGSPEGGHTPAHLETWSRHSRPPRRRRHHPRGHGEDGLRHHETSRQKSVRTPHRRLM
jgi:hypothetical protein